MYSRDKIAQTDKRNDRRRDRFNILKLKLFKHFQNIFIYKFRCIMYMQLGVYTNIDFKTFKMGFHTYFFYIKFETKTQGRISTMGEQLLYAACPLGEKLLYRYFYGGPTIG